MNKLLALLFIAFLAFTGVFWYTKVDPSIFKRSSNAIETLSFQVKYSPEALIKSRLPNAFGLSRDSKWTAKTLLVPHLLVEVKKRDGQGKHKTGYVLWDLNQGELISSLETWEASSVYYDLLERDLGSEEAQALKAVSLFNAPFTFKQVSQVYPHGPDVLEKALAALIKKRFLHYQDKSYQSYFQGLQLEPGLLKETIPELQRKAKGDIIKSRFDKEEIHHLMQNLLSQKFLVSDSTTIYLPIYQITVKDKKRPDRTRYYNSLTGTEIKALKLS